MQLCRTRYVDDVGAEGLHPVALQRVFAVVAEVDGALAPLRHLRLQQRHHRQLRATPRLLAKPGKYRSVRLVFRRAFNDCQGRRLRCICQPHGGRCTRQQTWRGHLLAAHSTGGVHTTFLQPCAIVCARAQAMLTVSSDAAAMQTSAPTTGHAHSVRSFPLEVPAHPDFPALEAEAAPPRGGEGGGTCRIWRDSL